MANRNRWVQVFVREVQSYVHEAMERLLRMWDPRFLDPSQPRTPVLGEWGIADQPSPVEEGPAEETFILEHGLGMAVDAVFKVYAGSGLSSEWGGPGMDWGWTDGQGDPVLEHAQGEMRYSSGPYSCVAGTAPTW